MRTGVHARMPGENLKGPIVGDFQSIAELREHLYQRCQNRCKTRAHAKELVLHTRACTSSYTRMHARISRCVARFAVRASAQRVRLRPWR